jgi:hypothetical protein
MKEVVGERRFEPPTPCAQGLVSRGTNNLARFASSGIRQYLCGFPTPYPHRERSANNPAVGTILGTISGVNPFVETLRVGTPAVFSLVEPFHSVIAVSFALKNQNHVCLEFLSKKFKKDTILQVIYGTLY